MFFSFVCFLSCYLSQEHIPSTTLAAPLQSETAKRKSAASHEKAIEALVILGTIVLAVVVLA
jgi:hypothetical protein